MSRNLGVASVQRQGFPGDVKANLDELENYIDLIAFEYPWVNLIVFPEMAVHGLCQDLMGIAEPIPGPSTERLSKKAKAVKKWIIPGSMLELYDGKIYNTMPVFSPEGELVAKYRKMDPFSPIEPTTPGEECVVVDIPNIGKLGLCICYDAWFPEMTRTLASMGAEVIYHPSFTPSTLTEQEKLVRRATALFNQVYVIGTGVCGYHCGTEAGHSMIVDPEGTILQEAGDLAAIQIEVLDLDKVKLVREIGTKGNAPMLKHLKHYGHKWSVYGNQKASSPFIDSMGSIYEMPKDVNKI